MRSRLREGRVRRAECRPGSRPGGQRPGAGGGGERGCGPRRRRRRGRPRSQHAGGASRQLRPDRSSRPRGARPGGSARCPRCGRDRRAALPQSRSGAATGRRPGARRSGREPRATLGPATGQDGATGAGAHPQAEPVGLRPPTVVRLEGALAHSWAPVRRSGAEATCLSQRCLSQGGEPMRPASVGRPRRNEKQWTAWTRDSGRRDGSTGSRYVRSSRLVKPNRPGTRASQQIAQPKCEPPTLTGSAGHVIARHAAVCPHRGKKTDGLWTTACWGPLVWVASPSAGRLPYPPARHGAPASRIDVQHDSEQLGPTRCDAREARWGPLCTQAVDDGVDERHHGTNRAIAPAHGWTSREHCDRRDHRNGQVAHGYPH